MANPRRALNLTVAAAIALGGVLSSAASCTSHTCVNGSCTVTFKDGAGATTLDSLGDASVEVQAVQGTQAQIRVNSDQGIVAQGQTQQIGPFRVTAEKVTDHEVKLKISR
ncbi:hypothetical protein [Actinomadura atramentaria]|uniref:hypothetical protein n=1 Tax=Actinomadura atramentaria TaxID=1990 RepID=UPI00068843EE|nr:hypothetical protein [Actinomadura atramentaria]